MSAIGQFLKFFIPVGSQIIVWLLKKHFLIKSTLAVHCESLKSNNIMFRECCSSGIEIAALISRKLFGFLNRKAS
jgi:hypothetical protein